MKEHVMNMRNGVLKTSRGCVVCYFYILMVNFTGICQITEIIGYGKFSRTAETWFAMQRTVTIGHC